MRQILANGQPYPRKRPINWRWVGAVLRDRREAKQMIAAGYRKHETDWEIHRGNRYKEMIVDAKISVDGMYVWTKIGPGA